MYARLAGQRHRRFIKTHTPLDGFREGRSGTGREVLARYHARAAALAPPDLLTWLHRGTRITLEHAARPVTAVE